MSNRNRIRIRDLNGDSIDAMAINTDWERVARDASENDDVWHYDTADCNDCGAPVVCPNGIGECPKCYREVYAEGPMMNYRWPLPDNVRDPEALALKINKAGPVCLVCVDGEWALALTGGGMDLSWEIAHAYVLAGAVPSHNLRLPTMAGMRMTATVRLILAAMRCGYQIQIRRARMNLSALRTTRQHIIAGAQKRAA